MTSGVIWLASYPRSGTTWLRAFLANLFNDTGQPHDINRLSEFTMSDMRARYFEEVAKRPLAELSGDEVNQLRPKVHHYLATRRPHTVFLNTQHAMGHVNDVPTITPDVTEGAIYVVRNPLDLVISYADHTGQDIDAAILAIGRQDNFLDTAGRMVFQYLSSWSEHVKSWTRAPGLTPHLMRYEDMSATPEKSFGDLARFLGVDTSSGRLERAIAFSSFGELKSQEQRHGFRERSDRTEAFFRQGREGAWRQVLTPAQVDTIVADHREVMAEFDYLP
ncbi:MAG: sulfotransferase domain-containing protein [Alphaproteobacteria bacterium]|jgi:hypothetical protein|nr:sulfotransferase domain-containing protein [Alphaproteobacteria bacterium]